MRNRIAPYLFRSLQNPVKHIPTLRGSTLFLQHGIGNPIFRTSSLNLLTRTSELMTYRHFSSDKYIPELMEIPQILLPKISYSLKNQFLGLTLIRPYFDKEFSIKEFNQGAKFAALKISESLSSGDLDELEDVCTPECLTTVKRNLSLFSMKQRAELDINQDDIFFSFLYQIGILMDDETNSEGTYGRQVECTWVAHAFKDYINFAEECNGNPRVIKERMDTYGGPTIINLRFVRDFSKNVEDTWTVNALNYYKLLDDL